MGLDETAREPVRQHAEATLNSIGDAVLSTDLDRRVVYLNSAADDDRLVAGRGGRAPGRGSVSPPRSQDARCRAKPDDVGDPAQQDRGPGSELHPRQTRWQGNRNRRLSRTHHDQEGRVTGAVIGVSRCRHRPRDVAQHVASRPARRADRPAKPLVAERPTHRGDRIGPSSRQATCRAVPGRRRLQDRQRHPRPCGGRRRAAIDCRAPHRHAPSIGYRDPLRRRRVRDRAFRDRGCGGCRSGREEVAAAIAGTHRGDSTGLHLPRALA